MLESGTSALYLDLQLGQSLKSTSYPHLNQHRRSKSIEQMAQCSPDKSICNVKHVHN